MSIELKDNLNGGMDLDTSYYELPKMKKDEWRYIQQYNGQYSISENGEVKSHLYSVEGKLMRVNKSGRYSTITLRLNGKVETLYIHRLVAGHFVDNPLNLPEVNHLNFDTKDNRKDNLQWATSSQNKQHSIKNGRMGTRKCYAAGVKKTRELIDKWDFSSSLIVLDTNSGVFYRSCAEVQRLEGLRFNLRYYHKIGKYKKYKILD